MGEGRGGTHYSRGAKEEARRWRMLMTMMMVVVGHNDGLQQRRTQQSTTLVMARSKEGCAAVPWGGIERSSVPGALSSASLVDTRLCKIYNEYEICKMQYAKGGSCRMGWV
jgi:hypothetical protein